MTTVSDTTDTSQPDYAPRWPGLDLQYLETVDIVITGAKAETRMPDGSIIFTLNGHSIRLTPENADAIKVTRSTPADGEPEPGDLWVGQDGVTYAALTDRSSGVDEVGLARVDGKSAFGPWRTIHKGPSGPIRLLFRLSDGGAA